MRYLRDDLRPLTPNGKPSITNCLAHRCAAHSELPPMDASADDGSECGLCLADKVYRAGEEALEADVLKRLFWPMVDSARDRLNLLAPGAGDSFVEECRAHVATYNEVPDAFSRS